MRFAREPVVASVPYAYDAAWNLVREPDETITQLLSLIAGATLCVATLVGWLLLAPFHAVRIGYATLTVAIVIVAVVHEIAHVVAFTMKRGTSELRVACAWRKWRPCIRYEGAITRNHYVLVLAAPLIAVSWVPVAVASIATLHSGDVVLVSMLNALTCGSDFVAALLVLVQVPAGALVRRQGDVVLWKARAPRT